MEWVGGTRDRRDDFPCFSYGKERVERVASSRHRMISGEESYKVSIIVVNWNGERFLKDFLGALSSQSYANCEIILVDNGSSNNSVRFAREKFAEAKIIALKKNRGFIGVM